MKKIIKKAAAFCATLMIMSTCALGATAATTSYMKSVDQTKSQLTKGTNACYRTLADVYYPIDHRYLGRIKGSYTTGAGAKTTTYSGITGDSSAYHYAIIASGGSRKYGKEVKTNTFSETRCLYKWGYNPTYTFSGVYFFSK